MGGGELLCLRNTSDALTTTIEGRLAIEQAHRKVRNKDGVVVVKDGVAVTKTRPGEALKQDIAMNTPWKRVIPDGYDTLPNVGNRNHPWIKFEVEAEEEEVDRLLQR